jgi:hypothetical protein
MDSYEKIITVTLFIRTTNMYCNKYLHLFVVESLQDSSARNLALRLNKAPFMNSYFS